jgi:hypothetical protein
MKASDFSVSVRQLVAVLIPGAIWLCSFYLIALNQNLLDRESDPNAFETVMLILAIFLVGYSARRVAFTFGVLSGELCNWIEKFVPGPIRNWGSHARRLKANEATIQSAQAILRSVKSPEVTYDPADVPLLCKYYVLGEGELSRRVEELEAEINLYATMVAPLLTLLVALAVFWSREPRILDLTSYQGVALGAIAFMTVSFARRTASRRLMESHKILLMFTVLTALRSSSKGNV